jgi:hypothetical protein
MLLLILFCQGFFMGEPYLYRVQVERMDRSPIELRENQPVVVDLGWHSYGALRTKVATEYHHPIGNLQVYVQSQRAPLSAPGDFRSWNGFKVTIAYPPAPRADGKDWRLHLLVPDAPGAPKKWVPLEVEDKASKTWSINDVELKKYHIEVEGQAKRGGNGIEVIFLSWPADDEIFSWNG